MYVYYAQLETEYTHSKARKALLARVGTRTIKLHNERFNMAWRLSRASEKALQSRMLREFWQRFGGLFDQA